MFTFNEPSTCPLHLKCANCIMHAFRVQYICFIIAFYAFFTFFMLCFYMKHLRDQMDYDDRRRLARIVTETCAAISRRLNVFLTDREVKVEGEQLGKSYVFIMFWKTNSVTFLIENGWKVIVSLKICLNS